MPGAGASWMGVQSVLQYIAWLACTCRCFCKHSFIYSKMKRAKARQLGCFTSRLLPLMRCILQELLVAALLNVVLLQLCQSMLLNRAASPVSGFRFSMRQFWCVAEPQNAGFRCIQVLMLHAIRHKNIVQFYGACLEPECYFIVTELMAGKAPALSTVLQQMLCAQYQCAVPCQSADSHFLAPSV